MVSKRVPNKLKGYRKSFGLTQIDVAEILDLSHSGNISRWETGEILPSLIHLCQLSLLYKVDLINLYPEIFDVMSKDMQERIRSLENKKFMEHFSLR
jgi:transcriptional regulator with XRE-family HTH domain